MKKLLLILISLLLASNVGASTSTFGFITLGQPIQPNADAHCPANGIQLNVKATFKPPSILTGASKVLVEYGYNAVTDHSLTLTSCGSGCTGTIVAPSTLC